MSRVVVVGAGVGGLAAALRLAAAGHQVTVLEQAATTGGKLGTWSRDGFHFDTGPSLLTMPHLVEDLFTATGNSASEALKLRRLDQACGYRFPDGTDLVMPGYADAVPAALDAALGPGTGDQWAALMARADRIWAVTHEPFLESPVTVGDLLRLSRRLDHVLTVAPWRTLRGLGGSYLRDPRLRMLLDRYATYSGSDPRRAPAALLAVPYAEQTWGSWYVEGGLRRLADALTDRARALGVEVVTGARVTAIETGRASDGGVRGVRLADGTAVAADVVVANADARTVLGQLVTGPGAATARRTDRRAALATPSFSGFVMLLSLDRPPPGPHHRVFFAEDYDAEFDALFGRGGPPHPVERPTIYVTAPDDPLLTPGPDTGAWFVLVNAPRHDPTGRTGVDWDAPGLADRYGDRILILLADRGLDLRPHLRHRDLRTPADLERATLSPGGAIYGTSSNGTRAAFLRPANAPGIPGLHLVGGSAHPGGGLPLVLLSAHIVTTQVGGA